jgi:putative transposase
MALLKDLFERASVPPSSRLALGAQQPRRALERLVRQRVVDFADVQVQRGSTLRLAAAALGIAQRTLRHWYRTCEHAVPLGRPLTPVAAASQLAVRTWIDDVGPGVGVPSLRRQFADLPRAVLDQLVKDYRQAWREENRRLLHVLTWQRPGTVWAMDFAKAPCVIDGRYRYLLAVRDLASGQQLLWQPVMAPTAAVVLDELALLFALHGAPWLLKTDNGSAFIADELRWYLHRCAVAQLFSPPYTPAYNGAIEASIGSLKTRTELYSAAAGHPGIWTGADLTAALEQANTQSRPRRLGGRTPQEVWQARSPLCPQQQAQFRERVEEERRRERQARGWSEHAPLTRTQQASVDRLAFSRALVAHDLLLFRRRRILPQISRPKSATRG